jgi:tetratricopeptide (TPR) repeat protein
MNCSALRSKAKVTISLVAITILLQYFTLPSRVDAQAGSVATPVSSQSPAAAAINSAGLPDQTQKTLEEDTGSADKVADEVMKHADQTMTYVSWMTTIWIALFTVVTGAAGVFLYGEVSVLTRARDQAQLALAEAIAAKNQAQLALAEAIAAKNEAVTSRDALQKAEKDAKEAAEHVRKLDEASQNALKDVDDYHEKLPKVQTPVPIGSPFELPPLDQVDQMEEADILTVLGAKLRPQDPVKLAKAFVSLGGYWRQIENYPRAIARYHKATSLDDKCWQAYEGVTQTLNDLAARSRISSEAKERLLTISQDYCDTAVAVGGEQVKTLIDLAWIADERGQFDDAITLLIRAREVDKQSERTIVITYNIACLYAHNEKTFDKAVEELEKIVDEDRTREHFAIDGDFAKLRQSPGFRAKLEHLALKIEVA